MSELKTDKLSKFRPSTQNANRHNARGLKLLSEAMGQVGYVAPITVAADGETLDGSARLETAFDQFGDEAIILHHDGKKPIVMVRDDIPNAHTPEAKRIAVEANRIGQIDLSWDVEVLDQIRTEVDISHLWNEAEWSELLESFGSELLGGNGQGGDAAPQVDRAAELQAVWGTEVGQVWQLGELHRLVIGDCTDKATVEAVMRGERAEMMFTDPPYGVDYTGGTGSYAGGVIKAQTRSRIKNDSDFGLYEYTFRLAIELLDFGPAYIWYADKNTKEISSLIPDKLELRRVINWYKVNQGFGDMGSDYHCVTEPCMYLVKGKSRYIGANNETNVWEHQRPQVNEFHPTEKPLPLVLRAVANHQADVIFDGFLGSGTTLIACQNLNRRCRAIEIDPGYAAVSLQRWADLTKQQPQRVSG